MMVEVSSLAKAVDTGEAGGHQLPNTPHPPPPPTTTTTIFWSKKFVFYIKLENTKCLLVKNMWNVSLFIE